MFQRQQAEKSLKTRLRLATNDIRLLYAQRFNLEGLGRSNQAGSWRVCNG